MKAGIYQLSDLDKCPFCGSGTFFVKLHAEGTIFFRINPDGSEENNENMYDTLTLTEGKRVYCFKCKSFLGNKETNKLSTPALIILCEKRDDK